MDLLALAEVRWEYFRTRKRFLLPRFPDRWRIFYAQPPGSGSDDPWTPRRDGNVTCFTVPFLKPATTRPLYNAVASTGLGRAMIEQAAGLYLRRMLGRLGVEREPVIMISNVYAARLLESLPHRLAVYDYNDAPDQFAGLPDWTKGYWARARDAVDLIVAVSEHYRRKLAAETTTPVVRVGNGVEYGRFATPQPIPDDLDRLPRPRVGYLGFFAPFLDFDLLEAIRQSLRGGTLVLAGPGTPATESRIGELAARGAVRLAPRPYEDVPGFMQGLDVGVIPFRAEDQFVRGLNPNKVYQYLASGVPVVTTPLSDLPPAPPLLQFASDRAGFVDAVGRALQLPRDAGACRALARPYDWDLLAARMVAEIEQRLPPGD